MCVCMCMCCSIRKYHLLNLIQVGEGIKLLHNLCSFFAQRPCIYII